MPPVKDRPESLKLLKIESTQSATVAMTRISSAVAQGKLNPTEGQALARLVEGFRKTMEIDDLERRIAALEETGSEGPR